MTTRTELALLGHILEARECAAREAQRRRVSLIAVHVAAARRVHVAAARRVAA